jgi:glyoxylase-like metal-dependent hydrolase (beta-lactamase superfamily II)
MLIHEIIPVGWLQCNCSILGDPQTREAIVVDPGDDDERIRAILQQHNLRVVAILNTHAHIDHVGGLKKIHELTKAPVLMHGADLELYKGLEMQAAWIGMPAPEMVRVDELLEEGRELRWGSLLARVMHTPGHTPGSVCLHLPAEKGANRSSPGRLIAGDTLFAGSIGRTDLWGGSWEHIMRSLHTKLLALPDETLVYPGHGPATTIGQERETNPFLQLR